jgi:ABC-type multidrug transport system ATPase subunit
MFKGMDESKIEESVNELIREVDLEKDYKKLAIQLSGGMKRRCSLGMSLTGNPKIVFLDEPSSGLDPVKRRHFWSLVKKVTKDKAVLLTTHLMEEADTLCSEIAIITSGKMRCIGNSIYLKKTFTDGFKIQIVLNQEVCTTTRFMNLIKNKLNGVRLENEFQGTLTLIVKEESSDNTDLVLNENNELAEDTDQTSNSQEQISSQNENKLSSIF